VVWPEHHDDMTVRPLLPKPSADGRIARGQRTRSRVLDAVLALQDQGFLSPTARMVADRAGVGLRTVFAHFPDMETLCTAAAQRQLLRLADMVVPVDPAWPLEERIQVFCSSRVRILEKLLPVMTAGHLRDRESLQIADKRQLFIDAGDVAVSQAFAPELDALDPTRRARRLDALYIACGGPTWEALRYDRELSPKLAAQVVQDAVRQALAAR
jgi:AcrR family transcriptional regulator